MPRGRLTLVQSLTAQYGKGCDERNLHHMRAFYLTFLIRNTLRIELFLMHHCTLFMLDNLAAHLVHERGHRPEREHLHAASS